MKSQFPPKHVPLRPAAPPSPKYAPPKVPGRRPMGRSTGPILDSKKEDASPPARLRLRARP